MCARACMYYYTEKREAERLEIYSTREWRLLHGLLPPLPPDMQHLERRCLGVIVDEAVCQDGQVIIGSG